MRELIDIDAVLATPEGLVIEVSKGFTMSGEAVWTARLSQATTTPSGNPGKPKKIATLVNKTGPAEVIGELTKLIGAGPVSEPTDSVPNGIAPPGTPLHLW